MTRQDYDHPYYKGTGDNVRDFIEQRGLSPNPVPLVYVTPNGLGALLLIIAFGLIAYFRK
jgi:hypothetical protein